MKNFVFVMFIFLNFNILTKCSLSSYDTNELNYFVYFLRDRNKIICTRREIENSSSISKSILPDYESSCLIELKQDGIYKLNLKLKEINFNSLSNLYENLNENDNDHSKKTLKIIIDENILVNNLEYDPHYIISQELFLKLDNGIVYYSNHDLCNDYKNKRNCRFIPIPNINPSQIKLDFDFASYDHNNNIVLIEKESKTNSNSCSPPCVNGICYNSSCFCKNGYMGANCSICKYILLIKLNSNCPK